MQAHQAMNNFGQMNRGFGGQPQPQRQGGRRGNNRGGFRPTRFDNNSQPQQQHQQRNQNQGQRPNEGQLQRPQQQQQRQQPPQTPQKPNQQQQPAQQQKPAVAQQQQQKPAQQTPQQQATKTQQSPQNAQQQKPTTPQQQPKPQQQQQQQQKPQQQQQQQKPQQQQQQQKPQQQHQQKPPQAPVNNGVADTVDLTNEIKPLMQDSCNKPGDQKQQQNMNGGNFGGNKGGWQGGNQRNRPDGNRPWQQNSGGQQQQQQQHPGGPRNQQRNNRPQFGPDGKPMREDHMLAIKLKELQGPLVDLPPLEQSEIKFNGRARLYIGNLTNDATEDEILNMFKPFGETAELFLNKEKNFGFIKMDYRVNAEKAKHELDGKLRNGRQMRVRFAPHNSAVRVKNLPNFVSNELLYRAFEIFGKIERAYVKVDERGRTIGEGVVEYARKPSALAAIRNCTERCFFLTASLRPVIVESYEEPDEADGYPEKNFPKKNQEYLRARENGPRFSEAGSFEHEYGTRWKQLRELYRQKEEGLKKELIAEEEKLEAQMEFAKYEHETEMLRQQLRQREQDRERQKRSWEMAERAAEERRDADRQVQMRHGEQLEQQMRHQDDELRRRQQENTLFVQAQRLNSMLDRQEQGMFDSQPAPMEGGFRDNIGRGYEEMQTNRGGWDGPRPMDDYPNKRRRF